jgi:hypothetical protein
MRLLPCYYCISSLNHKTEINLTRRFASRSYDTRPADPETVRNLDFPNRNEAISTHFLKLSF